MFWIKKKGYEKMCYDSLFDSPWAKVIIKYSIFVFVLISICGCEKNPLEVVKPRDDVSLFGFHLGQKLDITTNEVFDVVESIEEMKYHPEGCRRYRFKPVVPFDAINLYDITVDAKTGVIIKIMGEYDLDGVDNKKDSGEFLGQMTTLSLRNSSEFNYLSGPRTMSETTAAKKCIGCIHCAITGLEIKFNRKVERCGQYKASYEMNANNDLEALIFHCDKSFKGCFPVAHLELGFCMSKEVEEYLLFRIPFNCQQEIACYSNLSGGGVIGERMFVRIVARDNRFFDKLSSNGNWPGANNGL